MTFKVMQIEVSNECSLTCAYCPHPSQQRPRGMMSMPMFEKCIELVRRSGNPELHGRKFVHLNHFGEPLLNPALADFVRYASSQNVEVSFATNGVDADRQLFSRERWRELAEAGLRGVIVSCHVKSEKTLRRHIEEFVKVYWVFKPKPEYMHDWAGQVHVKRMNEKFLRVRPEPCDYETHDMFAITWDGRIAACCYDSEAGVSLTVDDVLADGFTFRRIGLCERCGLGRGDVKMLTDDFARIVAVSPQ